MVALIAVGLVVVFAVGMFLSNRSANDSRDRGRDNACEFLAEQGIPSENCP